MGVRRAIVIVLDGCGAGEAPDAATFNDFDHPSTLKHVWDAAGPVNAPHLAACGYLAAGGVEAVQASETPVMARQSRLRPLSVAGKDSVTGHWEMMGIVLPKAFPTYPHGFPIDLVNAFERAIGTQTIGNKAASGTAIIAELGALHMETGFPILYTSADSVFQIAAHEEVIPLERLYEMCSIARELCQEPNDVQRVIARPFVGNPKDGFTRTEHRKDYPLSPPPNLVDAIGDVCGIGVVPELFGGRGFVPTKRTQSNKEHRVALLDALAIQPSPRFIFANFEDFDMLFGHRNDAQGFARCLEEFDTTLAEVLAAMTGEDLLILTADHGNDPTTPSTDHSREFVPACAVVKSAAEGLEAIGDVDGFSAVGATVAKWLDVPWGIGTALV